MDDKCRKVLPAAVPCQFRPSVSGESPVVPQLCAPASAKVDGPLSARLVFGCKAGGAIVDSPSQQGCLEFGAVRHGPRFDIPGPLMRNVRDPAFSLSALSGVDPEGPVMVEIPPVADPGHFRDPPLLTGSRIGFASEYVSGNVRQPVEHSVHFSRVLSVLRAAGAQLLPVHALLMDDTRHFTLDQRNEINDRVTEHRLDVLVSDAQSYAFHQASAGGNPRVCVPIGMDADGIATAVWFYGAHWAGDRWAVLVQDCQRALSQDERTSSSSA